MSQIIKYLYIITTFLSVACTTENKHSDRIIGVKIYEFNGDFPDLFRKWNEIGINTVFASTDLLSNDEFVTLTKSHGIKTFAILPVFYAPDELEKDSSLFSITNQGEKAQKEWVKFACPSDSIYRKKKIKFITDFVRQNRPDVISLDFIRHFAYWEKVYPELPSDSLPNTCFDSRCLHAFQKETGITIPNDLQSTNEKFSWITSNHFERWVIWKSDLITTMVKDIVSNVKKIDSTILVNIHAVPWRQADFDGAINSVVGQDFSSLSKYADYISPMTYSHMVKRPPEWIHSVVKDLANNSSAKIIPSIQVDLAYLSDSFSVDEFKKCLDESLKSPSVGVIFWNWDALSASNERIEIVKSYDF